jgi:hypothetical protein
METLIQLWHSFAGIAQKGTSTLDMAQLLALAGVLGWASGIRLYAVVFMTGLAGWLGWLPLPAGLSMLQHPAVLAGSGFMLFVEFFADKIPGLDSLWDLVHSVIRVPAGAALAAGVFGADSATMGLAAGLLGGTLAATSYATKATTRAALNTSPEPFSNVAMSLLEDGAVMGMMWLATNYPVAFGVTLFLVVALSLWLLVYLFKVLKSLFRRIQGWLGGEGLSPHIEKRHV